MTDQEYQRQTDYYMLTTWKYRQWPLLPSVVFAVSTTSTGIYSTESCGASCRSRRAALPGLADIYAPCAQPVKSHTMFHPV